MIRHIASAITLTSCIVFWGELWGLTLQESVQYTINTNPDVLQSSSNRRAVGQELEQAKSGYFPTVDINLGIGWEQTNNPTTRARGDGTVSFRRDEAGILLRQMVFDGFATPSEVNRNKARVNSQAHTVFGTAENIALRVVEAYLNVLRRQELEELATDNLSLHQSIHDQILLRSERGVGRRADEDQSQGRLALALTNLTAAQGNLRDAKTDFLRVVGKKPDNLNEPDDLTKMLPESLEKLLQKAVDNQPTLKSANSDVAATKAQRETAKSPFYPRFDVEVGANADNSLDGINGSNDNILVMLRMRYNLFSGGKDLARKRETEYLINSAKEVRNLTRRQVEENARLSWTAYETVSRQLPAFERYKNASEKTYLAYKKQFNIGRRTLLDVLDSANEMFVARSDHTNTYYDVMFSHSRILRSMGDLNSSLQILLPEEATNLVKVKKRDD